MALAPAVGSLAQRMQHWQPIVKSEWILKTIGKGYRIQFMHSPPSFSRIIHTQAVGEAAHFLAAEIKSLLEKRAIQVVPPAQAMSGFYSRYFIIKKKGGGMRPTYIGSEGIEYASQTIQISDVDTFSTAEVRTSRRLVHHPGPGRRILPYPNLPPAQKVSQICLSRGDLRVFGSSFRTVTKPASLCEMHRGSVRSTQYERDSSGNLYRRLPPGCEFSTGGNCSYGTHDGTLVIAGVQVQLEEKCTDPFPVNNFHRAVSGLSHRGFSTLGVESRSGPTSSCTPTHMCSSRLHAGASSVETSVFPYTRRATWHDMCEEGGYHRRVSMGVGCHSRRAIGERPMEIGTALCSHQCSRTYGSVPGAETFSAVCNRRSCSGKDRQYDGSGLHQQAGRLALPSTTQTGTQTDPLEQRQSTLTQGNACAWSDEPRRRFSLTRAPLLWRVDTSPGGDGTDSEPLRVPVSRPVCLQGEHTMSPVLLSERSRGSARGGRIGACVAAHTPLRISPVGSDNPDIRQSKDRGSNCYSGSAELASETVVGGDNANALFTTAATPAAQGSVVPGSGGNFSSPPRTSGSLGLARERMNLTSCGLPQNVIMTIQSARAPSTRTVYEAKWRVFEDWCTSTDEVPFQCSVDTVLIFLQSLFDNGGGVFYAEAVSRCHISMSRGY